jgi:uncharacterized membrane protein YfcA
MLGDFTYFQVAFLSGAAFLAALVRGFSGFGSALVYMPLAAQFLTPFQALTTIVIFDLMGPLPMVRKASKECEANDLFRLIAGLIVALPLGVYTLTLVPAEAFQYSVSVVAMLALVLFLSGIRYRGELTPPLLYVTGASSGFLHGIAGIPGPPVILLYMASTRPVQIIRANTFLFLFTTDIVMLPSLALFGRLDPSAMILGAVLIIPNLIGILVGSRLFRPNHDKTYRTVAYVIIAVAAISGLPIWR